MHHRLLSKNKVQAKLFFLSRPENKNAKKALGQMGWRSEQRILLAPKKTDRDQGYVQLPQPRHI
jgi:hypothetical protein